MLEGGKVTLWFVNGISEPSESLVLQMDFSWKQESEFKIVFQDLIIFSLEVGELKFIEKWILGEESYIVKSKPFASIFVDLQ